MTPQPSSTTPRVSAATAGPIGRDRRASIAIMSALTAAVSTLVLGMAVDSGLWIIGSTQLQIAADAAAMGAGQLLTTSLQTQTSPTPLSALTKVATFEAKNVATPLVGTMNTPVVTYPTNFAYVDVMLTSQAVGYFSKLATLLPPFTAITPPLLSATARATIKGGVKACILTLATTGITINVNGVGTVTASSCPIFSNSNGIPAIYASGSGVISETGAITGTDIGAVGTVKSDNGGSITATVITSNAPSAPNWIATPPPPASGPIATKNIYGATGGESYNLSPQQWTGDVTFENSVTVNFAAGVYYVSNGSLTFLNAKTTFADNVSFILTGSNPGNFSWTDNTNSTNALTGTLSNIAIWQGCNSSGTQTMMFAGGSTLNMNGAIYAPCSAVNISNNAKIYAAIGKPFSLIAYTLTVVGSAGLRTAGGGTGGSSSGNAGPVLTQ